MTERSDYKSDYSRTYGKHGERSRGDDATGGDGTGWATEWTEQDWNDQNPKKVTAAPSAWDKAPPPPPPREDFPPLNPLPRKSSVMQEDARSEDNDELVEPTPKPEASSSSSYPKKKKYKVDKTTMNELELFRLLKEYVKTCCSFDSYGAESFCTGENNKLLEYKYFSRAIYALNLPAACQVRIDQDDSKEDAASIAHRVILKLLEDCKIGPTEGGGWGFKKPSPPAPYAADGFPIDGHGGAIMRPILQDTRANRFHAKKVNLLTIEYEKDMKTVKTYGMVIASPIEHRYQLTVRGISFRLEVEEIEWSPTFLEAVEKFHREIREEEEEEPEVMLVKVKREESNGLWKIDLDAMKDLEDPELLKMQGPFNSLIKKMERLSWWELVRHWSPAEPAACPLKLHKIFDEPDDKDPDQLREFQDDLECLKICGMDSLRLAAAVAESAQEREQESPDYSCEYLEKKVQDNYLNPDLAAQLMAMSGFIRLGTRKNVWPKDAADMLFALIGAHKLESDMFAVVQLWDYLIQDPYDAKKIRPTGVKSLVRANEYTAGCPRYLGRTSSYMEFGEVRPPEADATVGPPGPGQQSRYLKVRYEEYNDAYYRWNGSQAEEKRPDTLSQQEWKPLTWDPILGSFCSPSMKLPNGEPRPVPNKICAYLRGRCMKKLVSIKHSMESTPPYCYLREEVNTDHGGPEVLLYVVYKDPMYGEVCYRRDNYGGLGEEIFEDQRHLLSFSEAKKTLVSQVITGWALPRKVVTWLLEGRNLSDLIPGRKRAILDLKYEDDKVSFISSKGETVQVQANKLPKLFGHSGCLFEVRVEEDPKPKVVSYSEERKEWVFNAGKGSAEEVIPWEAIAHVTDKTSQDSGPRLTTPSSVRKYFPKASGTAVAKIEQQTDHRFTNVKFLAEALTHCSAVNSAVQPFDQLAFVGSAAIECYASGEVLKASCTFFNSHLVIEAGGVNFKTFCSPKSASHDEWDTMRLVPNETQEKLEAQQKLDSLQAMKHRVMACCNHVGFAASCIKNDLHKNINLSSPELQEHIERVCKKYPKDGPIAISKWPQLFKVGAPKALGDVFLACVGAITLDSDHNEARHLMDKHYKDSSDIFKAMTAMGGAPAEPKTPKAGSREPARIKKALMHPYSVEQELALVPSLRKEGELPDFWPHCKDLQIVEVEHNGETIEIACSSPRATVISLQLRAKEGSGHETDDEETDSEENEDPVRKQEEQEGAIYCKHCQMWLNGPTQWADHEIGKKHRKAVHRAQAAKQEKQESIESQEAAKALAAEAEKKTNAEHEAIFCKHCEMWLNGPTQWADHEIGKKHRKAVRRDLGLDEDTWKSEKGDDYKAYDKEGSMVDEGEYAGHMKEAEGINATYAQGSQGLEYDPQQQYQYYPGYDTPNNFIQVDGVWVAPWGDTSTPASAWQ